jgi:hypothetical protein
LDVLLKERHGPHSSRDGKEPEPDARLEIAGSYPQLTDAMGNYQDDQPSQLESGKGEPIVRRRSSDECSASHVSTPPVSQEQLSRVIEPHDTYEGKHRWDPEAEWTPAEEAAVVRKTDFLLLSWISLMVSRFLADHVSGSPQSVDLLT